MRTFWMSLAFLISALSAMAIRAESLKDRNLELEFCATWLPCQIAVGAMDTSVAVTNNATSAYDKIKNYFDLFKATPAKSAAEFRVWLETLSKFDREALVDKCVASRGVNMLDWCQEQYLSHEELRLAKEKKPISVEVKRKAAQETLKDLAWRDHNLVKTVSAFCKVTATGLSPNCDSEIELMEQLQNDVLQFNRSVTSKELGLSFESNAVKLFEQFFSWQSTRHGLTWVKKPLALTSDKMSAGQLLDAAEQAKAAGQNDKLLELLGEITKRFPATPAAQVAQAQLDQLKPPSMHVPTCWKTIQVKEQEHRALWAKDLPKVSGAFQLQEMWVNNDMIRAAQDSCAQDTEGAKQLAKYEQLFQAAKARCEQVPGAKCLVSAYENELRAAAALQAHREQLLRDIERDRQARVLDEQRRAQAERNEQARLQAQERQEQLRNQREIERLEQRQREETAEAFRQLQQGLDRFVQQRKERLERNSGGSAPEGSGESWCGNAKNCITNR